MSREAQTLKQYLSRMEAKISSNKKLKGDTLEEESF